MGDGGDGSQCSYWILLVLLLGHGLALAVLTADASVAGVTTASAGTRVMAVAAASMASVGATATFRLLQRLAVRDLKLEVVGRCLLVRLMLAKGAEQAHLVAWLDLHLLMGAVVILKLRGGLEVLLMLRRRCV